MKPALRFALPAYLLSELLLTLEIAAWLGTGPTLLLLLLGAAAGIAVLRRERFSILARVRRILASGEPLVPGLLDGALRLAAGVLLIVPGFVSDAAAAALLIPSLRQRLVRRLSAVRPADPSAPVVIEGDYRRIDNPALPDAKGGSG